VRIRDLLHREKGIEKSEILYLISHAIGEKKEIVLSRMDDELEDWELEKIKNLIIERKRGKPFAYITGRKEFFSHEFIVDDSAFIPRPETELLIEEAERIIGKKKVRSVLDMGTGSGAIGITIAKRTSARTFCVDISKGAIMVARKNARLNGVEDKVFFLCSDLFSAIKPERRFDLILANLPYVDKDEWEKLPDEVKLYEPRIALWGGEKGLEVIKRFLKNVEDYLSPSGDLLIEIGKKEQSDILGDLLLRKGFFVEVVRDYSFSERVLKATWRSS
jgi:release factor glutamine methyltransferase